MANFKHIINKVLVGIIVFILIFIYVSGMVDLKKVLNDLPEEKEVPLLGYKYPGISFVKNFGDTFKEEDKNLNVENFLRVCNENYTTDELLNQGYDQNYIDDYFLRKSLSKKECDEVITNNITDRDMLFRYYSKSSIKMTIYQINNRNLKDVTGIDENTRVILDFYDWLNGFLSNKIIFYYIMLIFFILLVVINLKNPFVMLDSIVNVIKDTALIIFILSLIVNVWSFVIAPEGVMANYVLLIASYLLSYWVLLASLIIFVAMYFVNKIIPFKE